MDLTTTYDIGQAVWNVWNRSKREFEKCTLCGGAGQLPVVGVDQLIKCPKCWGKGETDTGDTYYEHVVSHDSLTVGLARVTVEGPTYGLARYSGVVDQSNMGPRSYKRTEEYMCVETGVGSGRVYKVEDLFASKEDAEAEARARTQGSIDRIERYDEVASA